MKYLDIINLALDNKIGSGENRILNVHKLIEDAEKPQS
jgi:hypothetical protein